MKSFKMLVVMMVAGSLLSGCEKWKDIIHKEKEKDKVYVAKNLPMSGLQESPQRSTPATGLIDAKYNKKTKTLDFTVKWTELTNIPTGSHIHGPAPKGANAGIKYDFFDIFPRSRSGYFTNSVVVDEIAIKEDSLIKGYYYVNIHTATYPGGEIRGQIEFK